RTRVAPVRRGLGRIRTRANGGCPASVAPARAPTQVKGSAASTKAFASERARKARGQDLGARSGDRSPRAAPGRGLVGRRDPCGAPTRARRVAAAACALGAPVRGGASLGAFFGEGRDQGLG